MKKSLTLIIPTLIAAFGGTCIPNTAWADPVQKLWTYDEMLAFSSQAEAEIAEDCGDDFMCKESYLWSKGNGIYRAYASYRNTPFTITAINPEKDTVRVYHNSSIRSVSEQISKFYLAQYDAGHAGDFVYDLEHGIANPKVHVLLNITKLDDADSPITLDQEMEIPVAGDISTDSSFEMNLRYQYTTTRGYSAGDVAFLSDCFLNYETGKECQVRYNSDGNVVYVLVDAPAPAPDPTPVPTPTPDPDPTPDPATLSTDSDKGGTGENGNNGGSKTSSGSDSTGSAIVTSSSTTTDAGLTPDTGQPTAAADAASELPWWAIIPATLGLVAAVWFFWPNHHKKQKDSE